RVLSKIAPSALRGTILKRGKQGVPTRVPASHDAYFDWSYPHDFPEMAELYERAKRGQWNGSDLPWHIDVDPLNHEIPIIPNDFFGYDLIEEKIGVRFSPNEAAHLKHGFVSWMLSQ